MPNGKDRARPAQKTAPKDATEETVLILRTVAASMVAHNNFVWPKSGPVEAPDWDPDPTIKCGNGLHGLLFGVGSNGYLSQERTAVWQVVKALRSDVVESSDKDKVRFARGEVVYSGTMPGAYALVNKALIAHVTALAKTAAGCYAAKEKEHAASQGNYGHAASQGNSGHAASQGNYGHAASQGDSGHAASQGNYGCAFAGFGGRARASATGSFAIAWRDEKANRARLIVGTPGEGGVKADAGITSELLALAAALDVEAARRRGTEGLLEKVIDATFNTPLDQAERRLALANLYRELIREGPALTIEQAARAAALIAGGTARERSRSAAAPGKHHVSDADDWLPDPRGRCPQSPEGRAATRVRGSSRPLPCGPEGRSRRRRRHGRAH